MGDNQTQESRTKKVNNQAQEPQRLRTWQRLPAQTEQEPQSVASILNRTPSQLLSRQSISWPRTAVVQTKLTVNEPDDQYEQEADQVAETVMRMPTENHAPEALSSPPQTSSPHLVPQHKLRVDATSEAEQEQESDLEETDWITDRIMRLPYHATGQSVGESSLSSIQAKLIHRACIACEEETLAARKAAAEEPPAVTASLENRIQNMNGSGNPLPDSERSFFESRMGADFSGVRIHNDSSAVQTSRDLNARAFTVGNNVAFNSGEYQPGTSAGRHLLAHELTHVVQQGGAGELQRQPEDKKEQAPISEEAVPPEFQTDMSLEVSDGPLPVEQQASDSTEASQNTVPQKPENEQEKQPLAEEQVSALPQTDVNSETSDNALPVDKEGSDSATATEELPKEKESKEGKEDSAPSEELNANGPPQEAGNQALADNKANTVDLGTNKQGEESALGEEGAKANQEISDLGIGDLALIDEELAEHQQWAGASGKVGEASSVDRAEFIADTAGEGFLSGAETGFGMGLAMGGVGRAATKFIPVPGVGEILGGAMSVYGLASKDWSATGKNISEFGEGSSTYEQLANSLEAIGEIVDIISNIVGVVAGAIPVILVVAGALSATGILAPVAGPVAAGALLVATGASVASGILDLINSAILQPTAMLFRALHMFKSEADPREIEQQSQELAQAAGTVGGALGSAAGNKTADTVANQFDKPAKVDTDESSIKVDDSKTDNAAKSKEQKQLPESGNLKEITGTKNITEKKPPKDFGEELTKRIAEREKLQGKKADGTDYKNKDTRIEKLEKAIEVYKELHENYPDGVEYKDNGAPNFTPYAEKIVTIEMKGDRYEDFKVANKAAGFDLKDMSKPPEGYTWHHHEDGKTMELLPYELHKRVGHKGGVAAKNSQEGQKQAVTNYNSLKLAKSIDEGTPIVDTSNEIKSDNDDFNLKEELTNWWRANKATSIASENEEDQVTDDGQMERTEHVNPAYTDPPGTPEQIEAIQSEVLALLDTRAQAEQAEAEMAAQEAEHQENEAPLEEAVEETSGGITASEAHQEAVARRQQANLEQQQRQQEAQKNIADYANRAAGLAVLTVPLAGFERFTHYGSKALGLVKKVSWLVPDGIENQILSWKQNMDDMNKDAQEFQAALKQMDFAMSKQSSEQPARQQELQGDQVRIEGVNEKTEISKQEFESAHQGAQEIKQLNQDKIAEASAAKEEATVEVGELDNAIGEKEGQAQSLAETLQTWAGEHKAAREVATTATKEKLQSQGYEIVPSGE